jgi:hypothetical protein
LRSEGQNGGPVELRGQALYTQVDASGVTAPRTAIASERTREVLLLALEAADDILVGYTNRSFALGVQFEIWIEQLAKGD